MNKYDKILGEYREFDTSNLSDLGDVNKDGLTEGSVLKWNSTTEKWEMGVDENTTYVASDFNLSDLDDVDDSQKSEGKILKVNSEGNHEYVEEQDLSPYARLDGSNQPFTGNIEVIEGTMSSVSVNSIPDAQGGIDEYTKLLINFNGVPGSAVITDSSGIGNTITRYGNVAVDAFGKFGQSGKFDLRTDYLSIPYSTNISFGTEDYTIDFWIFIPTGTSLESGFSQGSAGGSSSIDGSVSLSRGTTTDLYFNFAIQNRGTLYRFLLDTVPNLVNTWVHVACVRSSNVLKGFVNGNLIRQTAVGSATGENSNAFLIGKHRDNHVNGLSYIDEFRISKGIARWTESFTPPAKPYDNLPLVSIPSYNFKANGDVVASIRSDGADEGKLKIKVSDVDVIEISDDGVVNISGSVKATDYKSSDGTSGVSGSFTSQDGKTVTVKNGLVVGII